MFSKVASLTSVGGVALAVAVCAAPASAGFVGVHPTEMQIISSDGYDSGVFAPAGTDEGNNVFNYQALGFTGDNPDNWNMDWDFNAAPAYDPGAGINGNFVIRNTSDMDLDFEIVITMPLLSGSDPGNAYFGSAGITIEHGSVSARDGDSLWQGLIDGAVQDSLFDDPYELMTDATDDDNAATGGVHGGAADSIGIRISLTLSAGGDFTMTSGFGITPAPGALAMLGLAGIAGRRRRRS